MKLSRAGVDLAKNMYQLHGVDSHGKAICEAMSSSVKAGRWPRHSD